MYLDISQIRIQASLRIINILEPTEVTEIFVFEKTSIELTLECIKLQNGWMHG